MLFRVRIKFQYTDIHTFYSTVSSSMCTKPTKDNHTYSKANAYRQSNIELDILFTVYIKHRVLDLYKKELMGIALSSILYRNSYGEVISAIYSSPWGSQTVPRTDL